MRTCSAGVVRPLGSPAAQSAQAAGPSIAKSSPAAAAASNEPLLASPPESNASGGGEGTERLAASASAAGGSEDIPVQPQLPAAKRPTRARKAKKVNIDAALQALADTQVRQPP